MLTVTYLIPQAWLYPLVGVYNTLQLFDLEMGPLHGPCSQAGNAGALGVGLCALVPDIAWPIPPYGSYRERQQTCQTSGTLALQS